MSMGSYYVKSPYTPPMAYSVDALNSTRNSGETIVGGVLYTWVNNETTSGFTGTNDWCTDVVGGPTHDYFVVGPGASLSGTIVADKIRTYLASQADEANLDGVFEYWQDNSGSDLTHYSNFGTVISSRCPGCGVVAG